MNKNLAKKLCKEHGIKGFRKLKLKREMYIAGKQCETMTRFIANNLLDSLIAKGFDIADISTCRQLADKGLLDTITIS